MLIINGIAFCILGKECRCYTAVFVIQIIITRQVQAKTAKMLMNNRALCGLVVTGSLQKFLLFQES